MAFHHQTTTSKILLILGSDTKGRWYELRQTPSRSLSLAPETLALLTSLRVLVVDSYGVVDASQVEVDPTAGRCDDEYPGQPGEDEPEWKLRLVSVHQAEDYRLAEVSWPDQPVGGPAGQLASSTVTGRLESASASLNSSPVKYLVRWEEDDNVHGLILTNRTSVSLPVRANSSQLVVQVSTAGGWSAHASAPLVIQPSSATQPSTADVVDPQKVSGARLSATIVLSVFTTALVLALVMLSILGKVYAAVSRDTGNSTKEISLRQLISPPTVNRDISRQQTRRAAAAGKTTRTTRTTLVSFESFLQNNNLSRRQLGLGHLEVVEADPYGPRGINQSLDRPELQLDISCIEKPNIL